MGEGEEKKKNSVPVIVSKRIGLLLCLVNSMLIWMFPGLLEKVDEVSQRVHSDVKHRFG